MAERKVRLMDVEALWRIERIGAVSLSPDGAQAVCSVTSHSMEENKGATSLWLLSTFGGEPRRLTACGEKDGQAAWSPKGGAIAFLSKREQEGQKDDTRAALPDLAGRRRGAPHHRLRAGDRGLQVVRRRPPHRLRLLGLARAEGPQGAGQALEGMEGAQGERLRHLGGAVPLLGPQPADGPGRPPARARHRQRPLRRPVRGQRPRAAAHGPGRERLRHRPGRPAHRLRLRSLRRRSASTTAGRWRRSTSPAAAARRWRSIPPGTSRRRATARTAGGSPSSPATSAAATPRPPTPRCSSAAAPGMCSPAPGTMRSTRPCAGRPTAARSGSPPRTGPAAISGASRSRARARRSPPRAAGCTGSTSPATPSSPSPTR